MTSGSNWRYLNRPQTEESRRHPPALSRQACKVATLPTDLSPWVKANQLLTFLEFVDTPGMHFIIADAGQPMSLQYWWVPLVSVVVGGLISLGSTLGVTFFAEHARRESERKRLAATLAGELEGIVAYLKRHKVEELLEAAAESRERPNVERIPQLRGSFLPGESGKIDESIGLLPTRLAGESSSVIILLRATVEDFTTAGNAWRNRQSWTDQDVRDFCKELAMTIKSLKEDASKLIPELRKEAEIWREPLLSPPG
jgi:hypothetical protein